jgi:hypothetical protein
MVARHDFVFLIENLCPPSHVAFPVKTSRGYFCDTDLINGKV